MEAYGSYEELLASGVELMQLMRIKREEEEDNRDLFSYNEEDEEYEENGNGEGAGGVEVRKSMGGVKDGEMAPLVPTDISPTPHSPHVRNNIDKGESNLTSFLKKPRVHYLGGDLLQFPPDSASIYSAPSMLSLHPAVESSKHEEEKVKQTVLEHFVKKMKTTKKTTKIHFKMVSCLQEQLYGPPPEEKSHGRISLATYYRYFRAGGSYLVLTIVLLVFLLGEVKKLILSATTL